MTARVNLEFFARLSGVADPRRAVVETLDYLDAADLSDRKLGSFP